MTRKEMISYCVDDQIRRGIIKAENRAKHITSRLTGFYKMSKAECTRGFNEVKAAE